MNIRCYLFGHKPYEYGMTVRCDRCGEITVRCDRCGEIEESEVCELQWTFRQRYGAIEAFRFFLHDMKRRLFPRCWNCGKSLRFGRRWEDSGFCSKECCDDSMPF